MIFGPVAVNSDDPTPNVMVAETPTTAEDEDKEEDVDEPIRKAAEDAARWEGLAYEAWASANDPKALPFETVRGHLFAERERLEGELDSAIRAALADQADPTLLTKVARSVRKGQKDAAR